MKAFVCSRYGTPDVLTLRDVPKPVPEPNQILIKVLKGSVNPADWHRMLGKPYFARLSIGLFKPSSPILGADIAGIVEAAGSQVSLFKPGDEVFGELGTGGFAEFALATEDQIALKPSNVSFANVAGAGIAGLTAYQGLHDFGEIQEGNKVLINGASGGVGTFAVQVAKAAGAEVTGVCSTRNLEMVHSIGADHTIDYTQENFVQMGNRYDIVYDAVGNVSLSGFRQMLEPRGRGVIIGFTSVGKMFRTIIGGKLVSSKKGMKIGSMVEKPNRKDMDCLAEMLEDGVLSPVIDRHYSWKELPEAMQYLLTMRARGKVILDWD